MTLTISTETIATAAPTLPPSWVTDACDSCGGDDATATLRNRTMWFECGECHTDETRQNGAADDCWCGDCLAALRLLK